MTPGRLLSLSEHREGEAISGQTCGLTLQHLSTEIPPGLDPGQDVDVLSFVGGHWVGKIPWRRERLPTPVFWPGEFHGLYSPWGHKES